MIFERKYPKKEKSKLGCLMLEFALSPVCLPKLEMNNE